MKRVTEDGYTEIKVGKKWVLEHRKVVEDFIGRPLEKQEVIHHIIHKNKSDNRLANLMIFPNQNEHSKWHIQEAKYGITNQMRRKLANRWYDYK